MDKPSAIIFSNVSRYFNEVHAVDNVSMEIRDGEFFSMLGPSGSGKTTCLRLIAGFERPDSGAIQVYGEDVSVLPPYDRPVNTVFQDYALFPHMTIEDNIAYGLMIKKVPKAERIKQVNDMLDLVQLAGFGRRKPSQLSGGQRQRVALARALINRPKVLLLDEPLGALDLKLRQQMQVELKSIQQRVGITFVFVTHDQEEALTMSDRIAVFNLGKVEQIGTPSEIYEHPASPFVAGFVGVSNIVEGELAKRITGSTQKFSIRPEKIHLLSTSETPEPDTYSADGVVRDVVYLGLYTRYLVELSDGGDLVVVAQNLKTTSMDALKVKGASARLVWKREHVRPLGN
ncbi:MAG: ABC transporter ATP-binding protein [Anaerolineae bacterium]|jgi:putative spermidine/putrescine transport system ATP-binding protein|nr:ABC transporter ATP-binding protein [Anaerolineae bacterium]MBL8107201.1 ABC transporter ATP-binding protein [Anaerolineales bacterium]MCC7190244.1 ABC transporter ATP-binding protein [Anaerolineales bacterium]